MTKVLILYYSSYGHVEAMALAEAEGVKDGGGEAVVKRVPELVPFDVTQKSGFKLDQPAPVAIVDELPQYDAVATTDRVTPLIAVDVTADQMLCFWCVAASNSIRAQVHAERLDRSVHP